MIRRNLMRAGAVVLTASMLGISVVGCGSSKETASVTAVNDEAAPQAESAITSAINMWDTTRCLPTTGISRDLSMSMTSISRLTPVRPTPSARPLTSR
jgi:hypothetical protein